MGEAEAALEQERKLGRVLPVEPADAMLAMVWEAAANVAVLRELVQDLDAMVGPGGLAGLTGSTAKVFDAAPHVLVEMYDSERERLVRWAKACRDAGVDERRVELAESQGRLLAQVVAAVGAGMLAVLGDRLDAKAREVWAAEFPKVARAELARVSTIGAADA